MANNVYLSNISIDHIPLEDQWNTLKGTQEYQSRYNIPLFWLCMFSSEHIKTIVDEEGESIPYLIAPYDKVIDNMSKRRFVIACLDPARLALYDQFCKRIAQADQPSWFMEASQIVAMSGAEDLRDELLRTFAALEDYTTALLNKNAASMQNHWFVTLLSEVKQAPHIYTPEVLVGSSLDGSWPIRANRVEPSKPNKKWWRFHK